MDVLVIGAGGHGVVVADALLGAAESSDLQPIGFLDDDGDLHGADLVGLPVLGALDALPDFPEAAVVVAVGDNATRARISREVAAAGRRLHAAIHPAAVIAREVEIEPGAMLCAGVVVNPGARVETGAILNTGCTVDHHCTIGAYSHIAPGAHLGGNVTVGEGALVSIGAAVIPGRTVGEWAVVGAGSAVIDDVPPRTTVVGKPARPVPAGGSR